MDKEDYELIEKYVANDLKNAMKMICSKSVNQPKLTDTEISRIKTTVLRSKTGIDDPLVMSFSNSSRNNIFTYLTRFMRDDSMKLFFKNHEKKLDSWSKSILKSALPGEGLLSCSFKDKLKVFKKSTPVKQHMHKDAVSRSPPLFDSPPRKKLKKDSVDIIEIESDDDELVSFCEDNGASILESFIVAEQPVRTPEIEYIPFSPTGGIAEEAFSRLQSLTCEEEVRNMCQRLQFHNLNDANLIAFASRLISMKTSLTHFELIFKSCLGEKLSRSKSCISRALYNSVLDTLHHHRELLFSVLSYVFQSTHFNSVQEDLFKRLINDGFLKCDAISVIVENLLSVKMVWDVHHVSLMKILLKERPMISTASFTTLLNSINLPSLHSCVKVPALVIGLTQNYPNEVFNSTNLVETVLSANTTFLKAKALKLLEDLQSKTCDTSLLLF